MSRKRSINKKAGNLKKLFANWLSQLIMLIAPQHLVLISGRGTGKTTDVVAKRIMDICYDMPGAYIAISCDTYMNALKNVLPSIIEGWERNGWIEGIHFVVNTRPHKKFYPKGYTGPYKPPLSWKHTITVFTGTHFKIISQDRPSSGAGDSYQHIVGDEVKYQAEKKINKLNPALRGEFVRFGHSPYYMGTTFTTDMPNPNHREHDWVLKREKNMDQEQIQWILQASNIVNTLNIEKVNAKQENDQKEINRINKLLGRWEKRLRKIRKGSTFFYIASSFVNVDILRPEYFKNAFMMDFREVMVSILSIFPKLEKGQMFYPNLSNRNFYSDGFVYDQFSKNKDFREIENTSLDLKYIQHHQVLEGGLDTGNMCSLVIGQQESEEVYRVLKEFYTLPIPPEFLPELGAKFRAYFKHHKKKHLKLWHDRAANKYQSVGEDHAGKMKKAIEYDAQGVSTDWTVELMSRDQGTIYQQTEYELLLELLKGNNLGLPKLLIDRANCRVLKGSMERAQTIIKEDKHGDKTIHKNKNSEKTKDIEQLLNSTNMSDALKYLVCRVEWLEELSGETSSFSTMSEPGVR